MSKGMLGTLSLSEIRGPRDTLESNLAGDEGAIWLKAFKRFLRKENPWGPAGLLKLYGKTSVVPPNFFVAADYLSPRSRTAIVSVSEVFAEHYLPIREMCSFHSHPLNVYALTEETGDLPLIKSLYDEGEPQLALFEVLLRRQWNEKLGPLLMDGSDNIAYIPDASYRAMAVSAQWRKKEKGWHLDAAPIGLSTWKEGARLISHQLH